MKEDWRRERRRGFTLIELLACPPKPSGRRRSRSAFTLIELLVVIAILGVLISLLMPALRDVTDTAKRMSCSSRLRQLSTGLFLYAGDQDGKLPSGINGLTATQFENRESARLYIDGYLGSGYGKSRQELLVCPGLTGDSRERVLARTASSLPCMYYRFVVGVGSEIGRPGFLYGWRGRASDPASSTATPLPSMQLIGSTRIPRSPNDQPMIGEPFTDSREVRVTNAGTVIQGHPNGTQTAFADGSVRWSQGYETSDFTETISLWSAGDSPRWK